MRFACRRLLAAPFAALVACTGVPNDLPQSGHQLFEGPIVNPLALSPDGQTLVRVNPVQNSISVFDLAGGGSFDVPVGVEPVSVAFRPKQAPSEPDLVFVSNHISDSVSVVDLGLRNVVQTVQAFDGDGVSTTNEPVGVAFAGPDRAFVALDQPNQVVVLEPDATGVWAVRDVRLKITAQGPRALAVTGDRLYVAAFESGNQSMTASCGEGLTTGCSWVIAVETATLPIIQDPNAPDRDLFVFDVTHLDEPVPPIEPDGFLHADEVVDAVGTLLYGVATDAAQRVYVTNTDARNVENGDVLASNRMFDNRLSMVDCASGCGAVQTLDLDAAAGEPVPTPHGVAVSQDGSVVLVVAAGAEAGPLLTSQHHMPGLFVFAANGTKLGDVVVGSIPQGVVLRSDPVTGAAQTAYVWNSYDGKVSVVDVTNPASPVVTQTLPGAVSDVPPMIRAGRLLFRSARASTSDTFACESCHPNGHIDQIAWVLNALGTPAIGNPVGLNGPQGDPESRVTLSVRGLRDTLPLHWDGSLGKPTEPSPAVQAAPQTCNLDGFTDPEDIDFDCFRHLVDASLAGVMCDQDPSTACPVTESRPGELIGLERIFLASYIASVAPHPGPARRPDDGLSPSALQGAGNFIQTPPDPVTGTVAGACTRTGTGCHELPLGTPPELAFQDRMNQSGFGGQPGPFRTLWDRTLTGSNGGMASHARMLMNSWATDYDPNEGPSERSALKSFVTFNFNVLQTITDAQFDFLLETSAGFSGLLGRQLTVSPAMVDTPAERAAVLAQIQVFEEAATEGRINAVGRVNMLLNGAMHQLDGAYVSESGRWELSEETNTLYPTDTLLLMLAGSPASSRVTIRADLPENVRQPAEGFASAVERQPLIRYDNPNGFTFLEPSGTGELRINSWHVTDPTSTGVYLDGVRCADCSVQITGPLAAGDPHDTTVQLVPLPAPGRHTLQLQADRGWFSNDLLFRVPGS